jgi:hypothetical protein
MSLRRPAGIVLLDRRILTVDLDSLDVRKIETGSVHSTARFLMAFGPTSHWLQGHYTAASDIRDRVALPCVYYLPKLKSLWVAADGLVFVEIAGGFLGSNPEFYQLAPAVADRFFALARIVKPTAVAQTMSALLPESSGESLNPGSKAMAAALQLKTERRPISIRAVCRLAVVDRTNLADQYPEVVKVIKKMAETDRTPRNGLRDRRTGNPDGIECTEDEASRIRDLGCRRRPPVNHDDD